MLLCHNSQLGVACAVLNVKTVDQKLAQSSAVQTTNVPTTGTTRPEEFADGSKRITHLLYCPKF